jgi:hypothetical protein
MDYKAAGGISVLNDFMAIRNADSLRPLVFFTGIISINFFECCTANLSGEKSGNNVQAAAAHVYFTFVC